MSEDVAIAIAKNLRELRTERLYTLKELSTRSGVSISMISKIENSQALPSIATYVKIAKALGASLDDLVRQDRQDTDISLVRASEKAVITRGPYIGTLLAYKKSDKKMEPFLLEYTYRKRFAKNRHQSDEMLYVIRGELEFRYGDKTMDLKHGDCAYYDGATTHGGRAASDQGATVLVVQSTY